MFGGARLTIENGSDFPIGVSSSFVTENSPPGTLKNGKNASVESRSGAVAGAPVPLPAHRTRTCGFPASGSRTRTHAFAHGKSSDGRSSGPGPARRAGTDRETVTFPDSSACVSPEATDGADARMAVNGSVRGADRAETEVVRPSQQEPVQLRHPVFEHPSRAISGWSTR